MDTSILFPKLIYSFQFCNRVELKRYCSDNIIRVIVPKFIVAGVVADDKNRYM